MKNHISEIAVACMLAVIVAAGYSIHEKTQEAMKLAEDQHTDIFLKGLGPGTRFSCSVEVDSDGNIIFENDKFKTVFGLDVGDNISNLLPEKSRKWHAEQIKAACKKHEQGSFKAFLEMKGIALTTDGSRPVWIRAWTTQRGCAAFIDVEQN